MAFEMCSPKLIDSVLAEVFGGPLIKAGFQKVRDRFYVRSRMQEMNDVVEFFRDRLELNFVWGLSLNFVPHITDGVENVRWHRTLKSAHKDLSYSGFGPAPELGWCILTTQGENELRRSASLTRSEMLPKALRFFEAVNRFQDLGSVFREKQEEKKWGWSFDMFTQSSLAYAFYLAKSGQEQRAREWMARWTTRHSVSYREETISRLSELFEEAVKSPFALQ
jgi:hypothetical protein